jgi:sugar phosphate permease
MQGLWAAAWLTDVEELDRPNVVTQLFVMAIALSVGGFLLGSIADQMRRRGIGPERPFALLAMLFIAAQLALILRLPLPSSVLWSLVALVGAGTVLSYATVAEHFPKELTGRANAVLNTFHFGWAFVLQYAIGSILQQWPSQDGHYPTIAYQVAFGFNIGLQVAALAWFELARLPAVRGLFRPSELLAIADRPTHTDDRP